MSDFLLYLGKVGLIASLLCLSYYFLLRKLSFHRLNRALLLAIIPISLCLPLLQLEIESQLSFELLEATGIGTTELWDNLQSELPQKNADYSIGFYLDLLYYVGLVISLFRLSLGGFTLFRQIKNATHTSWRNYPLLRSHTQAVSSSFKWIFIPENFDPETKEVILRHEAAHLKLRHSYDLLFVELYLAFCWFNPFAYLLRKMLKSVHEFQADEEALSSDLKTSTYLDALLKNSVEAYENSFSHAFSQYSLKARVEMISKRKDSMVQTGRYLILLPLLTFLLLSFAKNREQISFLFPIQEGLYENIAMPFGKAALDPLSHSKKVHPGIDILAGRETPIRASAAGKVIRAEHNAGWGNIVVIDHGKQYETRYAHMHNIVVEVGESVNSGELIGHVGSTGFSPSPHLHYEVRKDGREIQPPEPPK